MRERLKSAYFSPWWYLLLALLPLLSFVLHFGGHMVLGWDTEPPLRPVEYLMSSLSAWTSRSYFGQPNVFQITQAPLALLYVVLAKIFNIVIAEKLVLTGIFVLPAFTMYFCARRLFPRDTFVPFAAGWCFALCPLLFVRFYVPIVTVQLAYALLPLLVNVAADLARRGSSPTRLLWLAGVELACLPCASNLAYWLVPQLTAAIVGFALHLTDSRRALRPRAKTFWQAFAVALLVNLFWLAPQILFGLVAGGTFEHEAINSAYTAGVRNDVTEGAWLSYTFRMSSSAQTGVGDFNGPYWTYARALENGLVAAPAFLWLLLAALAIALRNRDRRVLVLGAMLCFGFYVMKGQSPPLGEYLGYFYHIPLVGTIFRNGYDKLLPMVAFSFSLLLPIAAEAIGRITRRQRAAQWALLAAVFLMAFPYWTGQMFMARPKGPTLSSMPPARMFTFMRTLDQVKSRVLFTPISGNPQLLATTWNFYGPNVYGTLTTAPFIAMSASIMNTSDSDDVMTSIYGAIDDRDPATFVTLTRDAGVGYVFVAHDTDEIYYGGESAAWVDQFLRSLGSARVIASDGPYTLWRLPWVDDIDTTIVRRPITGYNIAFQRAVEVAPACGGAPSTLIPLYSHGSCMVRESLAAQPQSSPGPVFPTRVAVDGGRLRLSRVVGAQTVTSTNAALPPASAVVQIGRDTVGAGPMMLSLVPCQPYTVTAFAPAAKAVIVPPTFGFPAADITHVALPNLPMGPNVVTIQAARGGVGASIQIVDALTGQPVTPIDHLAYPSSSLFVYSVPGRTYELNFGESEWFSRIRTFASSISIAGVAPTVSTTVVAPPPRARACRPAALPPAYAVQYATVLSALAVDNGTLLVHPYDTAQPYYALRVPLPPGSTLARIGDDVIGADGHDDAIPTGAALTVRGYRTAGSTRTLSIQRILSSMDAIVANVDRDMGSLTLQTRGDREWIRYPVPLLCGRDRDCLFTIRASSITGSYAMAINDDAAGHVIAWRNDIRSPVISFVLHPSRRGKYFLYIYASANHGAIAGVQIASVTVTPILPTGSTQFTIPRVAKVLPTYPDSIVVQGGRAVPSAPFDGTTLVASPRASALVLDTQFDPFWTTLVFPGHFPFVYFPQHAVADGYKNAWIIPSGVAGSVVNFYLSNLVAGIGLVICLVTLLTLIARALMSRAAKAGAAEARVAAAR